MSKTAINYKRIFQKLSERYPQIAIELTSEEPKMDGMEMLKVFTIFCRIKCIHHLNLPPDSDKSNLQALFVTIFVQIYDPDYFRGNKKALRRGLRRKMAALLNCHETQISHILSSVKTYLKAYKSFREEAGYIYSQIKEVLSNENQNHLQKPERIIAIPE